MIYRTAGTAECGRRKAGYFPMARGFGSSATRLKEKVRLPFGRDWDVYRAEAPPISDTASCILQK
jgi:hypothetical protein